MVNIIWKCTGEVLARNLPRWYADLLLDPLAEQFDCADLTTSFVIEEVAAS